MEIFYKMPHSNWRLQALNRPLEVSSVSDKEGSFFEFGQIVNSAGTKHCSQVIVLPNEHTDTNSTLQLYIDVAPKHICLKHHEVQCLGRKLALVNGLDFSSFCETMTAPYKAMAFTQRRLEA